MCIDKSHFTLLVQDSHTLVDSITTAGFEIYSCYIMFQRLFFSSMCINLTHPLTVKLQWL